jgi:hypothetical protein
LRLPILALYIASDIRIILNGLKLLHEKLPRALQGATTATVKDLCWIRADMRPGPFQVSQAQPRVMIIIKII